MKPEIETHRKGKLEASKQDDTHLRDPIRIRTPQVDHCGHFGRGIPKMSRSVGDAISHS